MVYLHDIAVAQFLALPRHSHQPWLPGEKPKARHEVRFLVHGRETALPVATTQEAVQHLRIAQGCNLAATYWMWTPRHGWLMENFNKFMDTINAAAAALIVPVEIECPWCHQKAPASSFEPDGGGWTCCPSCGGN